MLFGVFAVELFACKLFGWYRRVHRPAFVDSFAIALCSPCHPRFKSRARAPPAARRRPASTDHPFLFRFLWPTLWRRPADNAVDASCTIHNWTNTDFFFWRPTNKKDKSQFKVWNQSLFRCLWLGKLGPIFFPSFLLPTDDEKKSQASIFENHRHIPSFFSSSSPSHSTNDYLKRERERRTVWVSYIVFFLFRS